MISPLYLPVSVASLIFWVERHFEQHLSNGSAMISQYATGIKAFLFDRAGHLLSNRSDAGPRLDALSRNSGF